MWLVALITAGFGSVDPFPQGPVSENAVWGQRELDRYISANCPKLFAAAPTDPFALPTPQAAPAERIELQYAPTRDEAEAVALHRTFTWSYNAETQILTLAATPSLLAMTTRLDVPSSLRRRDSALEIHAAFPTFGYVSPRPSEVRQNAFGARVEVSGASIYERGIGSVSPLGRSQFPRATYGSSYRLSLSMPPDEARAFVTRVRLEVDATPLEWSPGAWLVHSFGSKRATLDDPTEQTVDGCYLNVIVSAVRVRDTGNGVVAKEWTTETDQRPAY